MRALATLRRAFLLAILQSARVLDCMADIAGFEAGGKVGNGIADCLQEVVYIQQAEGYLPG